MCLICIENVGSFSECFCCAFCSDHHNVTSIRQFQPRHASGCDQCPMSNKHMHNNTSNYIWYIKVSFFILRFYCSHYKLKPSFLTSMVYNGNAFREHLILNWHGHVFELQIECDICFWFCIKWKMQTKKKRREDSRMSKKLLDSKTDRNASFCN